MYKIYNTLRLTFIAILVTGISSHVSAQNGKDTVSHINFNDQFKHHRIEGQLSCSYGFIFGHSCHEFRGFGEKYSFSDTVNIEGIFAHIASNDDQITSTDSVSFKIYEAFADTSVPDNMLGVEKVSFQDIETTSTVANNSGNFDKFTYANFSKEIKVNSNDTILASIEFPKYRSGNPYEDTLTLRASIDKEAYKKYDNSVMGKDGNWFSTTLATYPDSLNVYLYLAPVINIQQNNTGRNPVAKKGGLGLINHYPNPVKNSFNVTFTLDQASPVNLNIYSAKGKLIRNKSFNTLSSGKHEIQLNLSAINSGNYIYMIQTPQGMLSGKLTKR